VTVSWNSPCRGITGYLGWAPFCSPPTHRCSMASACTRERRVKVPTAAPLSHVYTCAPHSPCVVSRWQDAKDVYVSPPYAQSCGNGGGSQRVTLRGCALPLSLSPSVLREGRSGSRAVPTRGGRELSMVSEAEMDRQRVVSLPILRVQVPSLTRTFFTTCDAELRYMSAAKDSR
jgi:hypothetical protein